MDPVMTRAQPPAMQLPGPAWPLPDYLRICANAWAISCAELLDGEQLAQLSRQRLQAMVAHARACSPLYARLYRDTAPGGGAELAALPVVHRDGLMENFDDWVADPRITRRAVESFIGNPQDAGAPFMEDIAIWCSSGTSNQPGIFLHDRGAMSVYDTLQLLRFRGLAHPREWTRMNLADERYAMVAAVGGHFAGVASVVRLQRIQPFYRHQVRVFSVMDRLAELVQQLNAFQPSLLATYPSVAVLLAQEQLAGRLHLRLAEIWLGGEGSGPELKMLLAQAFAAVVREEYGASEFGSIAVACNCNWLHVNADWVVLEPVDAHYAPVPPGTVSHTVLLTNLANHVQPLIRYDLGDSVLVREGACPCGSRLPAIRVQGRCDDYLEFAGAGGIPVRLVPLALVTVMEEGGGVYDFQLQQVGPQRIHLRLGAAERDRGDAALAALRGFLAAQGLSPVQVQLDPAVPRRESRGAKLRRVIRDFPPVVAGY